MRKFRLDFYAFNLPIFYILSKNNFQHFRIKVSTSRVKGVNLVDYNEESMIELGREYGRGYSGYRGANAN